MINKIIGLTSCHAASGIQRRQFRQGEQAVLADQDIVEPDLAAAVFRSLDLDQIPVDGGFIAVRRVIIAGAGCEMERSADFLVKQRIAERFADQRIETDGKFADIAGARIAVENLVQDSRRSGRQRP